MTAIPPTRKIKYWLFTNNFLVRHKKYYDIRADALSALNKIIAKSEIEYEVHLTADAKNEIELNLKENRDNTICQNKLTAFNGFTEMELDASIKLLQLDIADPRIQNIYQAK